MTLDITVDRSSPVPLYFQLSPQLEAAIAAGRLQPGDRIDTETEQLIQKAIDRVMNDRTSIIIAHRLSTIQRVDQIIVLHKGEIRERGTHQELLAQRGFYYKLYRLQFSEK